jgi:hypothetical protein
MSLSELIQRATSTKYVRALETDVARLRGENRALLNSILGIAGVPPIAATENTVSPVAGLQEPAGKFAATAGSVSAAVRSKPFGARTSTSTRADGKVAPAMRRRSWHQIYRMLEINSVRKKEASEIL